MLASSCRRKVFPWGLSEGCEPNEIFRYDATTCARSSDQASVSPDQFASCSNRIGDYDIKFDVSATVGNRLGMEDRWNVALHSQGHAAIFAVYDGHGGCQVSTYLMDNLSKTILADPDLLTDPAGTLKRSFETCDNVATRENPKRNPLSSSPGPGSTAVVLLIIPPLILVANVGDSRATLVNRVGEIKFETVDQRPTCPTESARLHNLGGKVRCVNGVIRVCGILAVSRAFGNAGLKHVVKAKPEVTVHDLDEIDTCIVCSDGLTDVVEAAESVDILLSSSMRTSNSLGVCPTDSTDQTVMKEELDHLGTLSSGNAPDRIAAGVSGISLLEQNNGRGAAKRLTTLAKTRQSMDNITALILSVKKRTDVPCRRRLRSQQIGQSDSDRSDKCWKKHRK